MNQVKAFLLKRLFPAIAHELESLGWRNAYLQRRSDNLNLRIEQSHTRLKPLLQEQQACLDALMSLVAINDDGDWSTVMQEDTILPSELQDYLHKLVARA